MSWVYSLEAFACSFTSNEFLSCIIRIAAILVYADCENVRAVQKPSLCPVAMVHVELQMGRMSTLSPLRVISWLLSHLQLPRVWLQTAARLPQRRLPYQRHVGGVSAMSWTSAIHDGTDPVLNMQNPWP